VFFAPHFVAIGVANPQHSAAMPPVDKRLVFALCIKNHFGQKDA
jgi:hypothetical protein